MDTTAARKLYSRDDLCYIMYAMLQGMRYWAGIENINWTLVDGIELPKSITAHDWVGEPSNHVILLNDVEVAIERIVNGTVQVNGQVRNWIASGDAGMVDAECGDVIAQVACFGELVYGP